jgi:MFS family permease
LDGRKKINARSILVWAVANLFYLYEVILRVSPSVMTDGLMWHYGITTGALGLLVSCFYFSYTALQIPCGLILDRLGPRNLISFSVILSILGSVLFAATDLMWAAQLGRFLVGAGAASAFVSSLQIASVLFPVRYFPLFAGITNMMGTFGALCGGFPVARSVNVLGWRETVFLLAGLGVIIALLAFLIIPKVVKISENAHPRDRFSPVLAKLLKNKQIILAGLVGGFMYLPISAFSELWAIPFFMANYNINNETASFAASTLFVGFALGSIPVAMVARKVNGYMKTIRFSIIGVALLFIPLIYVRNIYLSFAIVFLMGILTNGEVLVFTCAKNNESPSNAGAAIALSNGLIMFAGLIFQPVLGILLDLFWTGTTSEHGLRLYEISCYQKAILTLPICLVIAYILSLFMRETMELEKHQIESPTAS